MYLLHFLVTFVPWCAFYSFLTPSHTLQFLSNAHRRKHLWPMERTYTCSSLPSLSTTLPRAFLSKTVQCTIQGYPSSACPMESTVYSPSLCVHFILTVPCGTGGNVPWKPMCTMSNHWPIIVLFRTFIQQCAVLQ